MKRHGGEGTRGFRYRSISNDHFRGSIMANIGDMREQRESRVYARERWRLRKGGEGFE